MRTNIVIDVDTYLQGEQLSDIRHEYVAGQVFAMAGEGETHNRISRQPLFPPARSNPRQPLRYEDVVLESC